MWVDFPIVRCRDTCARRCCDCFLIVFLATGKTPLIDLHKSVLQWVIAKGEENWENSMKSALVVESSPPSVWRRKFQFFSLTKLAKFHCDHRLNCGAAVEISRSGMRIPDRFRLVTDPLWVYHAIAWINEWVHTKPTTWTALKWFCCSSLLLKIKTCSLRRSLCWLYLGETPFSLFVCLLVCCLVAVEHGSHHAERKSLQGFRALGRRTTSATADLIFEKGRLRKKL